MTPKGGAPRGLILFAFLTVLLTVPCGEAQTVTLNFDTPPLSAGVEIDAIPYLSSFGITVSAVTPGASLLIIGQGSPGIPVATSGSNYLNQFNGNNPETMTLGFSHPLTRISFFRTGMTADSKPEWSAEALDAQGAVVASAGEPLTATGAPIPSQKFTLSGNGIVALRINSNNHAFTDLSGVPIDDLTLVENCQIDPSSVNPFAGGKKSRDGHFTTMIASFTPPTISGQAASLADAATACGFIGFDWVQIIEEWPTPSALFAASLPNLPLTAGIQGSPPNGPIAPPFNDPPAGGYTYNLMCPAGFTPISSAYRTANPFYWAVNGPSNDCFTLLSHVFDSAGQSCPTLNSTSCTVLEFEDTPRNGCLFGGAFANTATCAFTTTLASAFMGFRTQLVGILPTNPPTPSKPLLQWTWKDNFNGKSFGGVDNFSAVTANLTPADPSSGTGGISITSINGVSQLPPSVSCLASPNSLWPPNGGSVSVSVSGTVMPGTSAIVLDKTAFTITDSQGEAQPSGNITLDSNGNYSLTVPLVAARDGNNKNGRQYTINVTADDQIGNVGSCTTIVIVPHDQRSLKLVTIQNSTFLFTGEQNTI